ncbi:hypothetical protein EVAR_49236_1 [Eumeta japonica]|uniref:Uncharacterized protein n=1 Tax=Eumeta variegata TaxID=151549 RepID=A0A4C1YF53_EUMVA|nr:hypothetical protein EVAR_49236_1 [Eumeta japonica]
MSILISRLRAASSYRPRGETFASRSNVETLHVYIRSLAGVHARRRRRQRRRGRAARSKFVDRHVCSNWRSRKCILSLWRCQSAAKTRLSEFIRVRNLATRAKGASTARDNARPPRIRHRARLNYVRFCPKITQAQPFKAVHP